MRPDRPDPAPAALLLNQAAGNREVYAGLAEEHPLVCPRCGSEM